MELNIENELNELNEIRQQQIDLQKQYKHLDQRKNEIIACINSKKDEIYNNITHQL